MKVNSAEFVISAPDLRSCPPETLPEFALIGRSNVGKSSLLNLLAGQADLARVSATPGHTRLINFFLFNRAWHLVDLPGYGYAKTAKNDPQKFQRVVAEYLTGREILRCVLVLLDSRLPPQQIDLEFVQWLIDEKVPFALVFTKADKLKPTALKRNTDAFYALLNGPEDLLPKSAACSAKTRLGRSEVLSLIAGYL